MHKGPIAISEALALEELKVKFEPELFSVFRLLPSNRRLTRITFSVDKNWVTGRHRFTVHFRRSRASQRWNNLPPHLFLFALILETTTFERYFHVIHTFLTPANIIISNESSVATIFSVMVTKPGLWKPLSNSHSLRKAFSHFDTLFQFIISTVDQTIYYY